MSECSFDVSPVLVYRMHIYADKTSLSDEG